MKFLHVHVASISKLYFNLNLYVLVLVLYFACMKSVDLHNKLFLHQFAYFYLIMSSLTVPS